MTHMPNANWFDCPACVEENAALGGGASHADLHYNDGVTLWGICSLHRHRWAVTTDVIALALFDLAHAAPDEKTRLGAAMALIDQLEPPQ